jgi:hypothetical protein
VDAPPCATGLDGRSWSHARTPWIVVGLLVARPRPPPRRLLCRRARRRRHRGQLGGFVADHRTPAEQVSPGDTVIRAPAPTAASTPGQRHRRRRSLPRRGRRDHQPRPGDPDGINISSSWIEIRAYVPTSAAPASAPRVRRSDLRRNRIDAVGTWGIFTGFCDDL